MSTPTPPLGPYSPLPANVSGLKDWRILILVTSVNSFVQKVIGYFDHLQIENYAIQIAGSAEGMVSAAEEFGPDVIICPFLTARIPDTVFTRVSILFLPQDKQAES